VAVHGLEPARQRARALSASAIDVLAGLAGDTEPLRASPGTSWSGRINAASHGIDQ